MKKVLLLAAMLVAIAGPVWGQYQVGDPVVNFTLRNWQGQNVSLSDYPDRIMFLVFWQSG